MTVRLFNSDVNVDCFNCKLNGSEATKIDEPKMGLTVAITNYCDLKCKFCCNPNVTNERDSFDMGKFKECVLEITSKMKLGEVNITGGEPTANIQRVLTVAQFLKSVDENVWISVNTNGLNIQTLDGRDCIDNYSLSCHHYDEKRNLTNVTDKKLKKLRDKHKVHISCNLMKGRIDSEEEVMKFLEYVDEMGYDDVGFVSLMDVNKYAKKVSVDFRDIKFENDAIRMYRRLDYRVPNVCACRNYAYITSRANIVKFYSRFNLNRNFCRSTRVYYIVDGLYKWYGGEKIR